jgi:hypothetical protein
MQWRAGALTESSQSYNTFDSVDEMRAEQYVLVIFPFVNARQGRLLKRAFGLKIQQSQLA